MSTSDTISLGSIVPANYTTSKQSTWGPEEIKEKLDGYRKISFKELVENQEKYVGTIVRYFRSGKFRTGGILSKVEITEEGNPPVGYTGFFSIRPKARWTSQSKTSEYWVQKNPTMVSADRKQKVVKVKPEKSKEESDKEKLIKTLREKWFTEPAKLSSKTGDKKIYTLINLDTLEVNTSEKVDGLKMSDEDGDVPSRVVYDRVKKGNNRPYKKKYFISRLNQKIVADLEAFLVSP